MIALRTLSLLFVTGSAIAKLGLGPAPVNLRTAGNYAILAQSGVSTVPPSAITGDVGVSPAAGSYLTGFSYILDLFGAFATSNQVSGELKAASFNSPTPAQLGSAVADMAAAYTDAMSRPSPDYLNLAAGILGDRTLLPGLYKWTTAVQITGDLTLRGGPLDYFILQIAGALILDAGKKIVLTGGARANNIVWAVAGPVTFQAGSHLEGIVLGKTAVTLVTGATMNGRIMCQTQVALQKATVVSLRSIIL